MLLFINQKIDDWDKLFEEIKLDLKKNGFQKKI